ncbi:MAG TPA: RAMP superfamily CRISPR-associated protein [Candidatus Dormibacteraeota bacterium]|nr:RAMP superfamily CRISPR-associated protein [Candidatus Dormibacteraeota bacterium]
MADALTIEIEFVSDWQVGSGTRAPTVDVLVARDGDDLPYVPAKTLTGIWRDACEVAARALDGGAAGAWTRWVRHLFGDQAVDPRPGAAPPSPAALRISPAGFGPAIQERLRRASSRHGPDSPDLRWIRAAFTFVKPGVRIDERSGRAMDDFLRFEEVARAGAVLSAPVELPAELGEEGREAALALLAAGAALIERLGGGRRRGLGRCRARLLQGTTEVDALRLLERIEVPPEPGPSESPPTILHPLSGSGGWIGQDLRLVLRRPVVAASQVAGNVTETLDHVPGAVLLAWFSGELRRLGVDPAPWIREGLIRLLPAVPEVAGQRGLPVPLCFFQPKEGGGKQEIEVHNALLAPKPDDESETVVQTKQLRAGYVASLEGDSFRRLTISPTSHTHNTIADDLQRPTSEVGGLYTYQAIPAGTVLRSRLLLDRSVAEALDRLAPAWRRSLVERPARLGRSRKDDFGEAEVSWAGEPEAEPVEPPVGGDTGRLTVWLETDLCLRDRRGRPATSVEELARALGEALRVRLQPQPEATFLRIRRLEGFHTVWGLPRPSLVLLAAGGCARFEVKGRLDPDRLRAVLAAGLGERRAEGFGRVRFDDPVLAQRRLTLKQAEAEAPGAPPPEPGGTRDGSPPDLDPRERHFARAVEEAAWRAHLARRAQELARDPDWRRRTLGLGAPGGPSPSQVGGLRSQLANLTDFTSGERVRGWLRSLRERQKMMFESVAQLVENPNRVWAELGLGPEPLLTGEDPRDRLWGEALRTLVDAAARAESRTGVEAASQEGSDGGA